ncbi:conserved hypothetical protein [Paraburkholderia piptadeniae]|uniref:Uncharacterized protein n=1 Tax=Paraburkholderia piptadeniae TaxID=1701573 RepID=A0A1N7RWH9_9BURK|nr:hypothetical protein [Paraburkholderia piptadeniae]SIT39479.1 conserved hypothetical protein [Paraburkholderia piptadeniae]
MKVAELLLRLKDAEPEAVVLLLPNYADYSEAEELNDVVLIAEPWTCERHHKADGTATDVHHPASHGHTLGCDDATDESWSEHVVILSPQLGSIEAKNSGVEKSASDTASLEDSIREQALQTRRHMVVEGQLLSADEFCARLGISKKRFGRMLADGELFGLDVDGTDYFPALLADSRLNAKRLQAICRIIVPAPAGSRHDFLSSPHGALGAKIPLHMLDDDRDYKRLREVAEAWAAQYSRTSITLYEGEHESEPADVTPLYTAITEIDPRKPLWTRASKAIHEHGYEWPLGPYPEYRTHTLFVARQSAGYTRPVPEACVQILAKDDYIRIRTIFASGRPREAETMPVGKHQTVVDVAKKVIAHFRKR